jgi:hypothetical protein
VTVTVVHPGSGVLAALEALAAADVATGTAEAGVLLAIELVLGG